METRNLLELHQELTRKLEAPSRFHNFSFLSCFAHALGRRVFLRLESGLVYPGHMMVLLLGPTGIKKTTAATIPLGMLMEARNRIAEKQRVNVMAERMSTEAMIDDLVPMDEDDQRLPSDEVDCVGMLAALEMSATFGNASYMEEMAPLLTRWADASSGAYDHATRSVAPYYYKKNFKKDGPKYYRNPTLTLLAATTPASMLDDLPPQVRQSGFLARLLTVYEWRSDRPRHDGLIRAQDAHNRALVEAITEGFRRATELEGEAELDADAVEWMGAWYDGRLAAKLTRSHDELTAGFLNRAQAHVLRIAVTLVGIELASVPFSGRPKIVVQRRHLEPAERMVMRIARDLPEAYGPLGRNQIDVTRSFVLVYLGKHGVVRRQALQIAAAKKKIHTPLLTPALAGLIDEGQVVQKKKEHKADWTYAVRKQKAGPHSGRPATADNRTTAGEYWENHFSEGLLSGSYEVRDDDPTLVAALEEEARRRERRAMDEEAGVED